MLYIRLSVQEVMEALGDTNRYYASREYGANPSTYELLAYYIRNSDRPLYAVTDFMVVDDVQGRLFDP